MSDKTVNEHCKAIAGMRTPKKAISSKANFVKARQVMAEIRAKRKALIDNPILDINSITIKLPK